MQNAIAENPAPQPEELSLKDFAESIFDLTSCSVRETSDSEQSITFESESFNYELAEMYLGNEAVVHGVGYAAQLQFAGDNGSTRAITVERINVGEKLCLVVYDIWQPEYNDENFVCYGTLKFVVADQDSIDGIMKREVGEVRQISLDHSISLAMSMLESAVDKDRNFDQVLSMFLDQIAGKQTYVYDAKKQDIVDCGSAGPRSIIDRAKVIGKRMDRAWGGAYIAGLLLSHPAVESFVINGSTSEEYDDNNYYTAKNISLSKLAFTDGVLEAVWPDDEVPEAKGEKIDADQYTDSLQDEIEDSGDSWTLYDAFQPDHEPDDFSFTVSRAELAALLSCELVDGLAVAEAVIRSGSGS